MKQENKKNLFTDQKGQVAVFVGVALVALVGILGYVIDEGSIYESRRSFQTVADSAALAGAQELPEHPSAAIQTAVEYAAMHEVPEDELTVVIEDTFVPNDTIRVTAADMDKPTFFAGVFGENSTAVGADATAVIGSPAEYLGVVPWGVIEELWVPGEEYALKVNPPGIGLPGQTGNFQALGLGGAGDTNYINNIAYGATVALNVGDFIDTEPGNMRGPTDEGALKRIYENDDFVFNSFGELVEANIDGYVLNRNDSQFVICPIIAELPLGRDEVEIIGFAPFLITELNGGGHEIIGTFLHRALIVYEGTITGVNENGIRVIRLVD